MDRFEPSWLGQRLSQPNSDAEGEGDIWWSNRGQACSKNVGWRIDYHIATPGIAARAKSDSVYQAERFSDYALLIVDYDQAF